MPGHKGESLGIIPFGKHEGKTIEEIETNYLIWLLGQEWFKEKFEELFAAVDQEINYRDKFDKHF